MVELHVVDWPLHEQAEREYLFVRGFFCLSFFFWRRLTKAPVRYVGRIRVVATGAGVTVVPICIVLAVDADPGVAAGGRVAIAFTHCQKKEKQLILTPFVERKKREFTRRKRKTSSYGCTCMFPQVQSDSGRSDSHTAQCSANISSNFQRRKCS